MEIKVEFGIDPSIEAILIDATYKIASFIVDDQAAVGSMQNMIATNSDLRVHLSVSILRPIKHEHPIDGS